MWSYRNKPIFKNFNKNESKKFQKCFMLRVHSTVYFILHKFEIPRLKLYPEIFKSQIITYTSYKNTIQVQSLFI